jgi:hypothetical protein
MLQSAGGDRKVHLAEASHIAAPQENCGFRAGQGAKTTAMSGLEKAPAEYGALEILKSGQNGS